MIEYLESVEELHGFSCLLGVGTKKALGYLPLSSIDHYGGATAQTDLLHWAFDNHLEARIYCGGHTGSGALYMWSTQMLGNLLYKYRKILLAADIPIVCKDYVKYIEHNIVDSKKYPDAYIVVGLTFNDSRFSENDIKL